MLKVICEYCYEYFRFYRKYRQSDDIASMKLYQNDYLAIVPLLENKLGYEVETAGDMFKVIDRRNGETVYEA